MAFLITVSDHAHGGGKMTIRQMVVIAKTHDHLVTQMVTAMTDYPFCQADPL